MGRPAGRYGVRRRDRRLCILDFESGVDTIGLKRDGFVHPGTIALRQGSGPQASTTAESTFLYDASTGDLSYDPDGTGSASAVLLARLGTGLTLSAGDFVFYY